MAIARSSSSSSGSIARALCRAISEVMLREKHRVSVAVPRVRVKPVSMYLPEGSELRVLEGCVALVNPLFLPRPRVALYVPRMDVLSVALDAILRGYSGSDRCRYVARLLRCSVRKLLVKLDGVLSRGSAAEIVLSLPKLERLGLAAIHRDAAVESVERVLDALIDCCNEALKLIHDVKLSLESSSDAQCLARALDSVAQDLRYTIEALWRNFVAPLSVRRGIDLEIPVAIVEKGGWRKGIVCISLTEGFSPGASLASDLCPSLKNLPRAKLLQLRC